MSFKRRKIVLAGGRELGYNILKWLFNQKEFELVGVCILSEEDDPFFSSKITTYLKKNGIQIIELNQIYRYEIDLVLSVNYNRIIPENLLKIPKLGFYNIHHSYNLRLKGRNITTHAILNARKDDIYYHGTTLHLIVPELDAGPIVSSYSCTIEEDDTAFTLFSKVDRMAYQLLCDWIPRIAFQKIYLYDPPLEGVRIFKNSDLPSKEMALNLMSADELRDFVRAFDFDGKEPAYFLNDNKKVHLVLRQRLGFPYSIHLKGFEFFSDLPTP